MFKKLLILVAIFTASAAALKAAQNNNQCPPPCSPCPQPCPETCPCPCPCPEDYGRGQGLEPIEEMQCGYNAPARIDVCGCWDTFITASFIYWLPKMGGLESGKRIITAADPTDFRLLHHDFEYDPGFKVGLGTHFDHDNWDLYVEYTWLTAKSKKTHTLGANDSSLSPQWFPTVTSAIVSSIYSIKSTWKPGINLLDLELARSYYVGTRLIFRTHCGARAGWLFQDYKIRIANSAESSIAELKAKSDSWLLGPRIGLDTSWIICDGFRILGNVAGTLAYQDFDTKVRLYDAVADTLKAYVKEDEGFVTPIFELGISLAWGTYFCENTWFFDLSVGYDFQYLFNQNRMKFLADKTPSTVTADVGDLMLHGLTITARIDF